MQHVSYSSADRRRLLVQRHLLDGTGTSPEEVTERLVAVHATDPATPFLSILARTTSTTVDEILRAMYTDKSLIRWMAMRRTVFVLNRDAIPDVQAAVSAPLSEVLRRRLITLLTKNEALPGTTDVAGWVADVEAGVRAALTTSPQASGAELSAIEPRLRTRIPVRLPSDTPQTVTSYLLAMMSAAGEIVRAVPIGSWTTRQHRWQHVDAWWPDGLTQSEPDAARNRLAERWLRFYGPATIDDLQWWTGWTNTATRATLSHLSIADVDLDGVEGIDLASREDLGIDVPDARPTAALLPALDSTSMGWKHRQWYSPTETKGLYDNAGNIGPTIWWKGRIAGIWTSTSTGVRTRLLADEGVEATAAIEAAAGRLEERLAGAVVTPAIRTPLERTLSS
jgi:hypothetical protein